MFVASENESLPRHTLVADELRRQILTGALPVGASLPSEAQLCERFGVSRGPVRQALAALRDEGLVGGGRGKPPVVRAQPLAQSFHTLMSFTAWARHLGHEPGQRMLEIARRPAGAELAQELALELGQPVFEVLRLRLLDGQPTLVERTAFIERVGRLLFEFDVDAGSIYENLGDRGVIFDRARHTIDAIPATSTDAQLLGVAPGAPLLRVRRLTTDPSGVPIEWSDDRYRSDAITFTIENRADTRPGLVIESNDSRRNSAHRIKP